MSIRPLVLAVALVLGLGLLVAPPTATASDSATDAADDPGLEVELDRAWRVSKRAAVELAYTVRCPEANPEGSLHAIDVQASDGGPREYLEFWCYPEGPQRVVVMVLGWNAAPGTEVTLASSTTNWLFASWEDGIPGAYKVDRTDTTTVKRGRFEPDSWADIKADLRLVRTRLTRSGGVRVVQRVMCDDFLGGPIGTDVVQRTDTGTVWARGWPGDSWLECEGGEKQTIKYVVQPGAGQSFTRGKAIVHSYWTWCDEGCPRGVSSDEVRLRPRPRR
jgi:hypothetical protein